MKKLVLVVLLTGCAYQQRPIEPTAEQVAVVTYLASQCGYTGPDVVQVVRENPSLKGCVLLKADSLNRGSSFGQALQGMGSVYLEAGRQTQQRCSTRRDALGVWYTDCY